MPEIEEPPREPLDPIPVGSGCGVRACLTAAVILFAVLTIGVLLVALLRPWSLPVGGTPFATEAVSAPG